MPTTTTLALPYPSSSDTVDVPRDIQALANALDTTVKTVDNDQTVLAAQVFN